MSTEQTQVESRANVSEREAMGRMLFEIAQTQVMQWGKSVLQYDDLSPQVQQGYIAAAQLFAARLGVGEMREALVKCLDALDFDASVHEFSAIWEMEIDLARKTAHEALKKCVVCE